MKNFKIPPITTNERGNERRAGFEFEVGNVSIEQVANALHKEFGGSIKKTSPFEFHIEGLEIGDLKIERDTQLLTSLKYRDWLTDLGVDFSPGSDAEKIEHEVDKLSRWLIPCEIVTSPIPFSKFDHLQALVRVLNNMGAEGTQKYLHYAFGLHINPEVPKMKVEVLLPFVQAFLLMTDWIIDESETDFSRRFFTKYIDPFPNDYAKLILDNDYCPSMTQFMDDYLEHNPTRNRPLDMLPIFHEIDQKRLMQGLPEDHQALIKGRPAFHYRLPDCRVGEPDWRVATEWNRWVIIEQIAESASLREKLIIKWKKEHSAFSLSHKASWVKQVGEFLQENPI
tara:strand:- start:13175 stop:14191 length:1017 start_codon:yes stop_codon:yes gene_type:complete